jgi:hypothetical protein
MNKMILPLGLAIVLSLASCYRSIVLNDGAKTRTVHVSGGVKYYTDPVTKAKLVEFRNLHGDLEKVSASDYDFSVR